MSLSVGAGGSEPRRRSVHFDACPTTLIVEDVPSLGVNVEVDEEYDGDTEGDHKDVLGVCKPQTNERRKSAPASSIRQGTPYQSTSESSNELKLSTSTLHTLNPELRRSLTKLCATTIEDPEEDLELVNFKLLGRDELEMERLKQMKTKKEISHCLHESSSSDVSITEPENAKTVDLIMAGSTNELASLIQRLEAVAIKLENAQGGSGAASEIKKHLSSLKASPSSALATLQKTVEDLELSLGANGGGTSTDDLSIHVSAFDDIVDGPFKSFLTLSNKIGGDVASQGRMVSEALRAQREFLVIVSKSKLPAQTDLQKLLKPTSDKINEIQTFRESNRRSEFFNHLSAISESIPALGWVTVSPAPSPFVKEMNDAGQFYANRVLKDWKEKDKTHVEWTKAWSQALADLQAYVKQYHTTGLVWNAKGGNAMSLSGTGGGAPSGPAGGPPLPPPPPPPGLFDDIKKDDGNAANTARNALFDEINRGGEVTKGLKKVTADMQTHKNPTLRSNADKPIPGKKPTGLGKPASVNAPPVTKPPKFELDGKKWIVEYFKNNPNIEIEQTETNQSVYVFRCEGSTIKVGGKCNNIILDGCKKTAIVFDNVVSSCEFINCQSVQMQVLGKVPTISVDKTDGCQMFLSKESMDTEIITAKSTEMNVMIPNGDDFVEQPVPEQFKTKIQGTKLTTTISESV